ncbi:hypothetical protein ABIF66_007430 [Bradyrhizobium japonicum]
MTDNLTKREQPDRSKINMNEAHEVKYWTRALGVTREELQKAVIRWATPQLQSGRSWAKRQMRNEDREWLCSGEWLVMALT